jgi:pimeloyl-ACP methyl ester carboxylesterase
MLKYDPVTQDQILIEPNYPPSLVPLLFYSNKQKVLGTMFITESKGPNPTVLLLNGHPGNEVNFDIAHMLQRQGLNVFTFYPRGSWGSQGAYSWKNILEDGKAAIEYLKDDACREKFHVDGNKIILIGYSMGGFSALYNSLMFEDIKNICVIAPFNVGFMGQMIAASPQVKELAEQKISQTTDFIEGTSTDKLIDEMIEHKIDWNILNYSNVLYKKNLLIIGALYDSTSPVDIHHKPFINSLQKAGAERMQDYILASGHSFSNKRIELMKKISDWVSKINL